jgi:hypothetical protein
MTNPLHTSSFDHLTLCDEKLVNWECPHYTVRSLIKLNATVNFSAATAWLTAKHYKVFPIRVKYWSTKTIKLTYLYFSSSCRNPGSEQLRSTLLVNALFISPVTSFHLNQNISVSNMFRGSSVFTWTLKQRNNFIFEDCCLLGCNTV